MVPALSIAPVPPVGADLSVMDADTRRMRGDRPFVFTSLKAGDGLEVVVEFLIAEGELQERAPV